MAYQLDHQSRVYLRTAHPEWRTIITQVYPLHPLRIICSHRGEDEQNRLFDEGRSKLRYPKSKHNSWPSMALDIVPVPLPFEWGAKSCKDIVHFYQLIAVITYEARENGHNIRSGSDWNQDGDFHDNSFDDLVHMELQLNAWE